MTDKSVPFGTPRAVQLVRIKSGAGGEDFYGALSALEASNASSSSLLPVQPVSVEGAQNIGSATRVLASVLTLSTQAKNILTAESSVGGQNVIATLYPYDPASAGPNKDIIRATGGVLSVGNPIYAEGAETSDDGQRAGIDVRAFLYAVDEGTTTQAVRLRGTTAGALRTADAGSTIITIPDTSLTTTPASVLVARLGRIKVIIQNIGTVETVRIGGAANITATRGIRLLPGEQIILGVTGEIFARAVSGVQTISINEIIA